MRHLIVICVAFTLFILVNHALAADKKSTKKLQIGVKKKVENCAKRSKSGDTLHMHYTGKLDDGTEFDSSIPRGEPFVFKLGAGQVIKGWDQGLLNMCEGEKRKLVIPSDLGYGERGAPPKIPGGATLIFEVELLKIEGKSEL
ncbi:Peptidyl-prolyl cis-trans isomerase FKBP2 [Acropora cervicornis]|uniref:peptidylprolyl isomerase n=1 Tax=Acropora cervicornis TaxID=6130 RepID=A0AAD9QGL0_ACRCE|nr:Peptidyl-prolyl cis-trans isomerase FKBP2 [Acropora cervicornis]